MYSDLYESYRSIYSVDEAKVDDTLTRPIDRSDARTARAGGDEPQRMLKHFMGRGVKKKKGMKEDYFNFFTEYLLDEGYADSWEDAEIMVSNMSQNWLSSILESSTNLSNMKPSEIKSQRQSIERQINDLVKQIMQTKDPVQKEKLGKKARSLREKLTAAKKEEGFHKSIKSTNSDDSDLTPEQAAKRRKVQKATYGSTPQTPKFGERAAPLGATAAQRAAERAADREVGYMDPTYYNRATGQRERIKAAGPTDVNYGGRGRKRVTGTYQQGATGSGERGATPAGSTVDPTRRRLRGTGRSTIQ